MFLHPPPWRYLLQRTSYWRPVCLSLFFSPPPPLPFPFPFPPFFNFFCTSPQYYFLSHPLYHSFPFSLPSLPFPLFPPLLSLPFSLPPHLPSFPSLPSLPSFPSLSLIPRFIYFSLPFLSGPISPPSILSFETLDLRNPLPFSFPFPIGMSNTSMGASFYSRIV